MGTLRYITAGESHGRALIGILEGIPAGLDLSSDSIDKDLKRRQGGYGRGGRMRIESDHATILSGVRWGKTIGSPIALMIENKDYKNWNEGMSPDADAEGSIPAVTRPRPGHADLAGALKYNQQDIRNILERSSARETAMRVALGAVTKCFLAEFGISVGSFVIQIGSQRTVVKSHDMKEKELLKTFSQAEKSAVRCPDETVSRKMVRLIDKAKKEGNSLGGIFEIFVTGIPIGLGSHIQWDRRLDGRLAQAVMGIQAMKGVEMGLGFDIGKKFGSEVMDQILYQAKSIERRAKGLNTKLGAAHPGSSEAGFSRETNFAGGIEGGITNGMPIILRAVMKPIPTQRKPLRSVDLITKKSVEAAYERSDICAVPAAGVIGEAMVALTIAEAFMEKFGGDSMGETRRSYNSYREYLRKF
jgi:chorismate synthase